MRLFDRLFTVPDPEDVPDGQDFTSVLNPESRVVLERAYVEPSVGENPVGSRYQFERLGYFAPDAIDHAADKPVFNRIVTLRDSWAKIEKQALAQKN